MRKFFLTAIIAVSSLCLSSCGSIGSSLLSSASGSSTSSSSAASTIGTGLLSSVTGTSGSSSSIIGNLLSSVLGSKTTQSSLVGTWTYSAPSVKFESENVLSQLGGTVVSSKIESAMSTQLDKIGFKKGKSTITFDSSNNFTMTLSGKSYSGTYTYNSSSNLLTLKGMFGIATLDCTCTVSAGTLYMLFDASKVLSIVSKVGSVNSTLSSLLSNYNGMKLGWAMTK